MTESSAADSTSAHVLPIVFTVLVIACIGCAYTIEHLRHRYHHESLHESGASMIIGALFGLAIYISNVNFTGFSEEVFFLYILPPIIFNAGYMMNKRNFFNNFGAIMMHGVVGTLIASIVFGLMTVTYARGKLYSGLMRLDGKTANEMDYVMLGTVLSATDQVAALTLLSETRQPKLFALIFGEGVANDAVTVVLAKALRAVPVNATMNNTLFWQITGNFLWLLFMSPILGAVTGFVSCFIFRKLHMTHEPAKEISLVLLFAYFCYLFAELCHLSGIMALFVNGIILSHYNLHNLSHSARSATIHTFHGMSFVAETVVFAYIGFSVFEFVGEDSKSYWDFSFTVLCMLTMMIARGCAIFPLASLANLFRDGEHKISANEMVVIWFAGLIRGAVAFALALQIQSTDRDQREASIIHTTTILVVLITTLALGTATAPLMRFLGVSEPLGGWGPDGVPPPVPESPDIRGLGRMESEAGFTHNTKSFFKRQTTRFYENIWVPFYANISVRAVWLEGILERTFGGKSNDLYDRPDGPKRHEHGGSHSDGCEHLAHTPPSPGRVTPVEDDDNTVGELSDEHDSLRNSIESSNSDSTNQRRRLRVKAPSTDAEEGEELKQSSEYRKLL